MGLDMYAYKIRKDLIPENQEINIKPSACIAKQAGLEPLPITHTEAERQAHNKAEDLAVRQAQETGIADLNFWYWRKFNHLHGWMHQLYVAKGGEGDFNCDTVLVTAEDFDALEKAVNEGTLVATSGFFFGGETLYPEDVESLKKFIAASREAMEQGYAILYDSWW